MTSRRYAVSASVLAVLGVLVLSACGGEKPSGLPVFTPSTSAGSSPTSPSKWTPEQQQVIDGYGGFTDLYQAMSGKAGKIDMAKVHRVAKDPYATATVKNMDALLSAGYVQRGKVRNTISAVTVTGDTAIIKTCYDQTGTKFINPDKPSAPAAEIPPPSKATVSLVREGGSWLLSGFKGDEGACVSG